ncbi:unnamed protein product [Spirodela intermedia]|uniref:Uncharacterized protein n=1 Tax=Spirodela intermedia TaxID=51605 RepID=A0A7I8J9Q0_SPIIN|nr:unnamed protein product [Spirodela intermedia]CAA6666173.1 unnamed protein product [Spirodela intermedia]
MNISLFGCGINLPRRILVLPLRPWPWARSLVLYAVFISHLVSSSGVSVRKTTHCWVRAYKCSLPGLGLEKTETPVGREGHGFHRRRRKFQWADRSSVSCLAAPRSRVCWRKAQIVPAVITFGDSSVDVGNNNYLPTFFRADFPPYGRDFVTKRPTGRFCNGKLATDITAESLGFSEYPAAYLSPEASGEKLLIGANFASAGSGYYDQTAISFHAIPLSQQLEFYKEYQSKLAPVARENTSTILSGALYIVSTGSSDFVQNYYINPWLNKLYSPTTTPRSSSDLHGLGARRIGVTSLPPLGCVPASITLFGGGSNECVARLNADAQGFNRKLSAEVRSLSKHLSNLKIAVFDIYKPVFDLVQKPSDFGNPEGLLRHRNRGDIGAVQPQVPGTCRNATGYVFFDSVHPSESANRVLADSLITKESTSSPEWTTGAHRERRPAAVVLPSPSSGQSVVCVMKPISSALANNSCFVCSRRIDFR